MARPERFELPTYCSGGLAARKTNNLHRARWIATKCYKCHVQQGFPAVP